MCAVNRVVVHDDDNESYMNILCCPSFSFSSLIFFLFFFFRFVIFYRPRILLRLHNRRWNAATARHFTRSYIVRRGGGEQKKWRKISERRQLLRSLYDFQPSLPWLTVFRNKSLKGMIETEISVTLNYIFNHLVIYLLLYFPW